MPRGDGTGPRGLGPMTGRQAGFCAGYAVPGYVNFGAGWTCRGAGGQGWRNRYYAIGLTGWQHTGIGWGQAGVPFGAPIGVPMNRNLELATLKTQADNLTYTLDSIRKRIEMLETEVQRDAS